MSNQHTAGSPCADFHAFAPIFRAPHFSTRLRLRDGRLGDTTISAGDRFLLYGMLWYVASAGDSVRLICEDGTERTILPRSLRRTLYRDRSARRAFQVPDGLQK